jgi:hypothetical protein
MLFKEINEFLSQIPAPTPSDLVVFANAMATSHPREKELVQEWFLEMIVKPRFSNGLFDGKVMMSFKAFSLMPSTHGFSNLQKI